MIWDILDFICNLFNIFPNGKNDSDAEATEHFKNLK